MTVPTRNGLQYSSVNGASDLTANYPAGSSSGDLVILQVRLSAASTTARTLSVGGGGWTNLITNANAGDGTWTYVWWKFRGAETSVTITPSSTADQRGMAAQIISYVGSTVHSSSPIDASNVVYQQPASTSLTGPTVTTTGDDRQILQIATALWVGGAVSVTWSAGVTEIADNSSAYTLNGVTFVASTAVEDKTSAGVTTARTATYSQSMFQRTILTIAVAPAPGPSTGVDDVTLGAAENATRQVVVAAPGPDQVGQSSATGTGTNLVINYPAGSQSGDYIVAVAHFYKTTGTTAPAITTPSGWTLLKTQTAGGTDPYRVGVYGRFQGAETSVTFVADTGTNVQSIGAAYAYRNVDAGVPVTDSQIVYELDTDSTFSVPSVTPTSVQNRLLKAYISNGQYQSEPAASWASSTEVLDIAQTIDGTRRVNLSMALGYQETAAASGSEVVTQAAPLVSLTALGMEWSGSWDPPDNSTTKRTGMTPQSGTSTSDIVNDALVVNGDGNITVTAAGSGSSTGSCTLRIFRNGTQVASGTATSATWTGDVVKGDTLDIRVNKTTILTRNYSSLSLAYTPNGTMVMFASDDFAGTGALNSANWATDGGGTLVRTNGELDGTGTPSVPLSFAWWKTPANSGRQIVKARIRWNGRNPEHSTAGLCVRADPFQNPLVNPGAEHGVMGTCTANLEAFYYEDYDQSDGGFPGLKFVTGSGGATSTTKYADNSLLEVESNGNSYTYRVNGVVKKSGTVSTSIIPETYRYVGLFIQDDSAESGGGESPAMLDDFEAWHEVPSGSGNAHTFGVVVALQAPQDIQINSNDAAALTGTESHSIAGILTAPTDAATVGYADNAPSIAHTGQATDTHPVGYADTVGSFTAQTSDADPAALTVTEAVTSFTGTQSAGDSVTLTGTDDQLVTNAINDSDGGLAATDVATGIGHTGLASDAYSGFVDHAVPIGEDGGPAVDEAAPDIAMADTDGGLAGTDDATVATAVTASDGPITTTSGDGVIAMTGEGELVVTSDAVLSNTATTSATDEKTLVLTEDGSTVAEAGVDDTDPVGATEASAIAFADSDTGAISEGESASVQSQRTVSDTATLSGGDGDGTIELTATGDAAGVTAYEVAFRSSDGILAAPRLVSVDPETRRIAIGAEGLREWPRRVQILAEPRTLKIKAE